MGYIIHEAFHFLVGVSIGYIFTLKARSWSERVILLFFCGVAAIIPDVTKFFGDNLGHSLWMVPVLGLLLTLGLFLFQRTIPFLKTWILLSLSVLIGHILIDYFGNGVPLVYPFSQEEFSFSIMTRTDSVVMFTLIAILLIGLLFRKGKIVFLIGIIFIGLYIGGLTVSKLKLEYTLKSQFNNESIHLLQTYREHQFSNWGFIVRTNEVWVSGYSPIVNGEIYIVNERNVSE